MTSGLTYRRFTNWAIQPFVGGLPISQYLYRRLYFWNYVWAMFWRMRSIPLHSTMQRFTRCCGEICSQSNQEHWGEPLLFPVSALFFLTCIKQHTGTWLYVPLEGQSNNEVLSCSRTQVSRLGLEPTLCWSETPGLESDVLMHSATSTWIFFLWVLREAGIVEKNV